MSKHYVDLDLIIDRLEDEWGYQGMREELYDLPSADVIEVKHGEWETIDYEDDEYEFRCSNCRSQYDMPSKTNFCPNCGADMRGEAE